jgi:hypothetical protein
MDTFQPLLEKFVSFIYRVFNVSKVTQRTPKLSVSSRGIGPKLGSFFGHYDPMPVGLVTSFVHACGLSFNHFLLRISAMFLQGAVECQICGCQLLQHLKCVCLHNMGSGWSKASLRIFVSELVLLLRCRLRVPFLTASTIFQCMNTVNVTTQELRLLPNSDN